MSAEYSTTVRSGDCCDHYNSPHVFRGFERTCPACGEWFYVCEECRKVMGAPDLRPFCKECTPKKQ